MGYHCPQTLQVCETHIDMAPSSRKGAKKSTTASKNVVFKALVGINGMPFSRFVKSFRTYSSFNVNLQSRYLDIWILWTSCSLLVLQRPCELFSWAARLRLNGGAFDTLTIKCLMVQRECQSLSMLLLLLITYATWVSFQWPTFFQLTRWILLGLWSLRVPIWIWLRRDYFSGCLTKMLSLPFST